MKRHRQLIHIRVAAEDASGVVEGKEFHKGKTDTKRRIYEKLIESVHVAQF